MKKELIDFAKWMQEEEYLVRLPYNEVTDLYLKSRNSEPTLRQSGVGQHKVQEKVCEICNGSLQIKSIWGKWVACNDLSHKQTD